LNTLDKIRQLIAERYDLNISDITPETTFEQLNIDSLGMFDLIFDAEEYFGVSIDEEDFVINNIQDVANLLDKLIKEKK
jgi:acyl carrier protein